ncbi:MAG: hypothetical protein KY443_08815 [Actinobacteria bacterium]|nr:hypothetical protein [Actinomycetota bacterium]
MLHLPALLASHGGGVATDEADAHDLVAAPALLDGHVRFLRRRRAP